MEPDGEDQDSRLGSFIYLLVVLGFCVVIGAYLVVSFLTKESLRRADCIELTETYKRWLEAGKPDGEALGEFMRGRRRDLVVTNRSLTINGTNFLTQFAVTKPKAGTSGILFITTNQFLIWVGPSGNPEIVQLSSRRVSQPAPVLPE